MDKGEATEKVVQMLKIVASTNHEGESDAAMSQAIRLRLTHGISDADLERAQGSEERASQPGGLFGGWLGSSMYYHDNIRLIHVEAIKENIQAALRKIGKRDIDSQVRMLADLYDDLRGLVEAGAKKESYRERAVQWHRNQAVKKLYEEECKKYVARERELHRQHPQMFGRNWQGPDKWIVHERALFATTLGTNLTKAQVEAIVGIKADDQTWEQVKELRIKEAKEQGCTCTPRFYGKRQKTKPDKWTTHYDLGPMTHMRDCALQRKEA